MHAERAHRLAPLLRWPFLLALGLLILNDAVLKAAWHNAFTGKLSDFAGVFAFAYFWAVVIGRARTAVHVAVAVAFAWWKSPWSAGAIEAWNGLPLFDVARVVDYGDLFALIVLPLSCKALAWRPMPSRRGDTAATWPPLTVAAIALVAFTATSRPTTTITIEGGVVYLAPLSPEGLLSRSVESDRYPYGNPALFPFVFTSQDCSVKAEFELQSAGSMMQMTLQGFLSNDCDIREHKLTDLFSAMQPELRARLGARLLQPYTIPENALLEAAPGSRLQRCDADEPAVTDT